MNIKENLKYAKTHEWVRVEGEHAYIGISDFAQSELGDIVYVDVPTVGENLSKGDVFGTIEAVKTVSDVYLPISGEVIEFNEALATNPLIGRYTSLTVFTASIVPNTSPLERFKNCE